MAADLEGRFEFGRNWAEFARDLDDERFAIATQALRDLAGRDLVGQTFLDAGCGSGLSSLAAVRLGAAEVHAFDYDAVSVATTQELQRRAGGSADWKVERGDLLDAAYMRALGTFDVVHCWGAAHHTGAMWKAVEHLVGAVAPGGLLLLAVYNDQGTTSRIWRAVKHGYQFVPDRLRPAYVVVASLPLLARGFAAAVVGRRTVEWVASWRESKRRGMSRWHDLVDWVGGYPFEVASVSAVTRFCESSGLRLVRVARDVGRSSGCNELVFERPIRGL